MPIPNMVQIIIKIINAKHSYRVVTEFDSYFVFHIHVLHNIYDVNAYFKICGEHYLLLIMIKFCGYHKHKYL